MKAFSGGWIGCDDGGMYLWRGFCGRREYLNGPELVQVEAGKVPEACV